MADALRVAAIGHAMRHRAADVARGHYQALLLALTDADLAVLHPGLRPWLRLERNNTRVMVLARAKVEGGVPEGWALAEAAAEVAGFTGFDWRAGWGPWGWRVAGA